MKIKSIAKAISALGVAAFVSSVHAQTDATGQAVVGSTFKSSNFVAPAPSGGTVAAWVKQLAGQARVIRPENSPWFEIYFAGDGSHAKVVVWQNNHRTEMHVGAPRWEFGGNWSASWYGGRFTPSGVAVWYSYNNGMQMCSASVKSVYLDEFLANPWPDGVQDTRPQCSRITE